MVATSASRPRAAARALGSTAASASRAADLTESLRS